jgi:hypothetical protein
MDSTGMPVADKLALLMELLSCEGWANEWTVGCNVSVG